MAFSKLKNLHSHVTCGMARASRANFFAESRKEKWFGANFFIIKRMKLPNSKAVVGRSVAAPVITRCCCSTSSRSYNVPTWNFCKALQLSTSGFNFVYLKRSRKCVYFSLTWLRCCCSTSSRSFSGRARDSLNRSVRHLLLVGNLGTVWPNGRIKCSPIRQHLPTI